METSVKEIPVYEYSDNMDSDYKKFLDTIIEKNFITYHTCTDICKDFCTKLKTLIHFEKIYVIKSLNIMNILNIVYFKKNNINWDDKKINDFLVITLDQEINDDIFHIMKKYNYILFAGFTGKIKTILPDNVKYVVIYGDSNKIIPYLNRNLLNLLIIDQHDNDNIETIYNLENIPDSIEFLSLNNNCVIKSYPKKLKLLFIFSKVNSSIVIDKLEEGVEGIITNCDIHLKNCPNSLNSYTYHCNNETSNFNIDNLHFKNLEILCITSEIDVKTFYKLPKTIVHLVINCTIEIYETDDNFICPFPNLKNIWFIDQSWIFSELFFETSNINEIHVNKKVLKYLNPLKLGSKCKKVGIVNNMNTYNIYQDDTDDEFYEEAFNIKFPLVEPIENNTEQLYPLNKGVYQQIYKEYNSEKSRQIRKYKLWVKDIGSPFKIYKCKMTYKIDTNKFNILKPLDKSHYQLRNLRKLKLRRKHLNNIILMLYSKNINFTYKNIKYDSDFIDFINYSNN